MAWLILLAAAVMLGLAVFMTYVLGWANKALHVEVDPKIKAVTDALPGANCGGCGYLGCGDYAEAVVTDGIPPNLCPVGGPAVASTVAEIVGIELKETVPLRPAVHCMARCGSKPGSHEYRGEQTCATANLVAGVQGCTYGCLGLGDCVSACLFDAISLVDDMIQIDYDRCIGCGACVRSCPRNIISMIPFKADSMYVIACRNKEKGKDVNQVCQVGCKGCTLCQKLSGGLIHMEGNIAVIDYELYDPEKVDEQLEPVLAKCPSKGIFQKIGPSSAVKSQKPDAEKAETADQ